MINQKHFIFNVLHRNESHDNQYESLQLLIRILPWYQLHLKALPNYVWIKFYQLCSLSMGTTKKSTIFIIPLRLFRVLLHLRSRAMPMAIVSQKVFVHSMSLFNTKLYIHEYYSCLYIKRSCRSMNLHINTKVRIISPCLIWVLFSHFRFSQKRNENQWKSFSHLNWRNGSM